jgi:hypothetical protein
MPHVTITDTYPDKEVEGGFGEERLEFEVATIWDSFEPVMNDLVTNCSTEMVAHVAYEWGKEVDRAASQSEPGFEVRYATGHGSTSTYAYTQK